MYLTIDLFTPLNNAYVINTKIRNLILRHWPTKIVNGIEVFDRFYYYNGSVVNTSASKQIYKILGTSYSELSKNNYKGVDAAWLYFKPWHIAPPVFDATDVANYVNDNSVLNEEYTVKINYSQEIAKPGLIGLKDSNNLPVTLTNEQIIQLVEGGFNSQFTDVLAGTTIVYNEATSESVVEKVYEGNLFNYEHDINPTTFVSLMDVDDVLFDSTTVVTSRTLTPIFARRGNTYDGVEINEITGYTFKVALRYTYSRKIDASDVLATPVLDEVVLNVGAMIPGEYSMYKQARDMLHITNPVLPGELLTTYSVNPIFTSGSEAAAEYIRKDAASELKRKDFAKMVAQSLDSDYQEESCSGFFSCALGFFLVIVIIVIAIYTGGAAVGLLGAGASSLATAAAFLGSMSLTLALGSMVMTGIQMVLSNNGQYGTAISFGKSIVILNKLSMVVGIMATIVGIGAAINAARSAIAEAAKTAAAKQAGERAVLSALNDTTTEIVIGVGTQAGSGIVQPTLSMYVGATVDYGITSLGGLFSSAGMSTMQMINKIVGWLNTAVSFYTKVVAPVDMPDQPAQDTVVDETPLYIGNIDLINTSFESYGFIDINEQMDNMCDNMTAPGLERRTLCKYYNALGR